MRVTVCARRFSQMGAAWRILLRIEELEEAAP